MKKYIAIASMALAASFASADLYSGAGGAIPDNTTAGGPGVFTGTINVGSPVGTVSFIRLNGLTHSWAGDLIATVTNASGVSVRLFERINVTTVGGVGEDSNFGGDYRFLNGGANIWTAAGTVGGTVAIPAGDYEASSRTGALGYLAVDLSSLNNSIAGDWTLTISDNFNGDTGAFTSWDIEAAPVPEPATMAALGVGVVALLRRRKKA